MNHITLMGRLTRDPELRHTPNRTPVTSFTLAVERIPYAKDGEKQVDFIDCIAWRGTAEFVAKYFAKGGMIAIEGRLQIRDWTDKEGNRRRSSEVICSHAYFTSGGKKGDSGQSDHTVEDIAYVSDSGYTDDDVPF